MFAGRGCEIHLNNARARLYSADFRPADKTHIKAILLEKAISILAGGVDISEAREGLMEATKPDLIRYIKCVSGDPAPAIFKIAREHGIIVERAPPYRPGMQPIKLIWSHIKGDYSRRYEGSHVVPSLEFFSRDLPVSELIATSDD